ncbi:MAG TPA: indole-3-glycerol phosphate synthase TrpC [Fibrobacteraceae bacterium]|nr:indole-3-glycerol phosphate synthase TrpC [Fibrobacteraceae bacterium]
MSYLDAIVAHKRMEIESSKRTMPLDALMPHVKARKDFRGLLRSLEHPGIRIISEIKRRSPSKGDLALDLDPATVARAYELGGAAALSVLTDAEFFGGNLDDLMSARNATDLPVLRKEFILDDYQIYESVAAGADAILLIARILDDTQMVRLLGLALDLGLDVLLEVHNAKDLERARRTGARLIGINNRDLGNFNTDLGVAMELSHYIAKNTGIIPVALSGISGSEDIAANWAVGIRCFLVGESLVKAKDPAALLQQMCTVPQDHP